MKAFKSLYDEQNLQKAQKKKLSKKLNPSENTTDEIVSSSTTAASTESLQDLKFKRDEIMKHFIVGTNAVTSNLQSCIKTKHWTGLECIFVCKEDVEPSILYQHVPTMAHLASRGQIRICALSKSMEVAVSKAFGIKRVALFGIHVSLRYKCG